MRFLRKGPRLPYETRARWPERCRLGGSCRKSPTSGNPTISKRFPRRIRHQCGISLLPEQEQTRDAVVEANTWTTIQTDFLDQLIRENCLGVQDNLETVVEFVPRSPRWELSLVAPWLRLQPAKLAPFFADANIGLWWLASKAIFRSYFRPPRNASRDSRLNRACAAEPIASRFGMPTTSTLGKIYAGPSARSLLSPAQTQWERDRGLLIDQSIGPAD